MYADGLDDDKYEKFYKDFAELKKKRNIIEHFVFKDSVDTLLIYIVKALNSIIDFIHEEFSQDLDADENFRDVKDIIEGIQDKLKDIEAYKDNRMIIIKNSLDLCEWLLNCPICHQKTLGHENGDTETFRCYFCNYQTDDYDKLLEEYVDCFLYSYTYMSTDYIYECPMCESEHFVHTVDDFYFCFNCKAQINENQISSCQDCHKPLLGNCICNDCLQNRSGKDNF